MAKGMKWSLEKQREGARKAAVELNYALAAKGKRTKMGKPSPWTPEDQGHVNGGPVRRLSPEEIARLYPGVPVRFGPRR